MYGIDILDVGIPADVEVRSLLTGPSLLTPWFGRSCEYAGAGRRRPGSHRPQGVAGRRSWSHGLSATGAVVLNSTMDQ